jgi:hypothetical protein
MKIMTTLIALDSDLRVEDSYGVLKMTLALARMLLGRKLLMELAGALQVEYFVMEFTEDSMKVMSEIDPKFQIFADALMQGSAEWLEVFDIPETGKVIHKIGFSACRLTKDAFWWVMEVESADGFPSMRECTKVRTGKLPWDLVTKAAGDFDPKAAIADESFLIHWGEE